VFIYSLQVGIHGEFSNRFLRWGKFNRPTLGWEALFPTGFRLLPIACGRGHAVATNILTDGASYFSDPQWTNHDGRFYRVVSP
jgi:hypothetical protein